MDISKKYNDLRPGNKSTLRTAVNSFIPTPTDVDYAKGYITRFFVQRVNDKSSPVFEVSNVEFGKLQSNVLFNTTSLRWRISGPKEMQFDSDGRILDKGIKESNKKSIELASDNIINLKLYLPNTLQFSRNG
jgi:hypothetical protein